jgi:hypothetical protein
MRKTKELFIYGVVLFALAVIDVIMLVMDFSAGEFAMITSPDALAQDVTNAIILGVLGLIVLSIAIGFYLGVKGIEQSRRPTRARLHIFLARLCGTLNLILTVFMALTLFGSTDLFNDLATLASCGADMILMYAYANAAKAVRNGAY